MILVKRTPCPTALQKNAASWLSELEVARTRLEVVRATPKTTKMQMSVAEQQVKKAQDKYRHIKVKNALVEMFHGKCAYCESKITVVTYGAIEHFRPKFEYPDQTFKWENLLLSCDICNDKGHKGSQFPVDHNGNPLLIDPTDGVSNPNVHLEFIWDDIGGLASVYGGDERGKMVETIFDLNGVRGRKELINARSKYLKHLLVLLRFAQNGDHEATALLEESCKPDAQYSAFARIYISPYLKNATGS